MKRINHFIHNKRYVTMPQYNQKNAHTTTDIDPSFSIFVTTGSHFFPHNVQYFQLSVSPTINTFSSILYQIPFTFDLCSLIFRRCKKLHFYSLFANTLNQCFIIPISSFCLFHIYWMTHILIVIIFINV